MNKIINGKKYNTETAEKLDSQRITPDKYYYLYKKKNGELFIHVSENRGAQDYITPRNDSDGHFLQLLERFSDLSEEALTYFQE